MSFARPPPRPFPPTPKQTTARPSSKTPTTPPRPRACVCSLLYLPPASHTMPGRLTTPTRPLPPPPPPSPVAETLATTERGGKRRRRRRRRARARFCPDPSLLRPKKQRKNKKAPAAHMFWCNRKPIRSF